MIEFSVKKCLRQVRWVVLPGAAALLSACSYAYELRVTVVAGENVDTAAITDVSIIIAKVSHQRSQLSDMATFPVDEDGALTTEICCTPNPQIWVYAFHDANGSGHWDSDELLVADNNSPVRLDGNYAVTFNMP